MLIKTIPKKFTLHYYPLILCSPSFIHQVWQRSVVMKARNEASALGSCPLQPYVSATLHSERERGRRDNTPP